MRGGIKGNAYAFFAGGRLRPCEAKAKNRVLSFLHYNKTNPVNGYISRFTGLCCIKYEPRERVLSERGVILCKILILYRFFHAKSSRFPRRFPHRSRRGGNLPPAKMRSIFLCFSAQHAEYNRGIAALTANSQRLTAQAATADIEKKDAFSARSTMRGISATALFPAIRILRSS